ncbi:hypothetical protein O181_062994 [Austropuccinia psidii MF-1]|uniref:Uncharacterized protein n=1 Tax=Austropuccinia psidii MF-1 TaxID=1389203 RepID=A0A9Q3ELI2_9BASI|nr:hypothetical protein [Austropuccinia psidii MF-1]
MCLVHLRSLGIQRNKPEDSKGLFITRGSGTRLIGHNSGWQDTEGNNTHSAINLLLQQKPKTSEMEGYGSISSAPPNPQRLIPMNHGHQEVQPSITRGRTWSKLLKNMSQRDTLQGSFGNYQSMESQQAAQTTGGEVK